MKKPNLGFSSKFAIFSFSVYLFYVVYSASWTLKQGKPSYTVVTKESKGLHIKKHSGNIHSANSSMNSVPSALLASELSPLQYFTENTVKPMQSDTSSRTHSTVFSSSPSTSQPSNPKLIVQGKGPETSSSLSPAIEHNPTDASNQHIDQTDTTVETQRSETSSKADQKTTGGGFTIPEVDGVPFKEASEASLEIQELEKEAMSHGKTRRPPAMRARHNRVEGTRHAETKPDSSFYTSYLHNTLELKPAYPVLKGFMHKVIEYFPHQRSWLDAGAGTCGFMQALRQVGRPVVGVELSDVTQTTCAPLYKKGLVKQGPLNKIPYPDHAFDVVFTSEVLEHVPTNLVEDSIKELIRCSRGVVFATISLRPSALDKPGRPPKVHLTVRPREWWEEKFRKAGCVRDEEAFKFFQEYGKDGEEISPRFFPFNCKY